MSKRSYEESTTSSPPSSSPPNCQGAFYCTVKGNALNNQGMPNDGAAAAELEDYVKTLQMICAGQSRLYEKVGDGNVYKQLLRDGQNNFSIEEVKIFCYRNILYESLDALADIKDLEDAGCQRNSSNIMDLTLPSQDYLERMKDDENVVKTEKINELENYIEIMRDIRGGRESVKKKPKRGGKKNMKGGGICTNERAKNILSYLVLSMTGLGLLLGGAAITGTTGTIPQIAHKAIISASSFVTALLEGGGGPVLSMEKAGCTSFLRGGLRYIWTVGGFMGQTCAQVKALNAPAIQWTAGKITAIAVAAMGGIGLTTFSIFGLKELIKREVIEPLCTSLTNAKTLANGASNPALKELKKKALLGSMQSRLFTLAEEKFEEVKTQPADQQAAVATELKDVYADPSTKKIVLGFAGNLQQQQQQQQAMDEDALIDKLFADNITSENINGMTITFSDAASQVPLTAGQIQVTKDAISTYTIGLATYLDTKLPEGLPIKGELKTIVEALAAPTVAQAAAAQVQNTAGGKRRMTRKKGKKKHHKKRHHAKKHATKKHKKKGKRKTGKKHHKKRHHAKKHATRKHGKKRGRKTRKR
jgi:hypothetical protein